MINIILYSTIGASVLMLGFVVCRKIPELVNLTEEEIVIFSKKKGLVEKIREINFKKYWFDFVIILEKFLRKIKVFSLKTDNLLNKWIKVLRTHSQIMAQRSKEWMRQKESKRREKSDDTLTKSQKNSKINIDSESDLSTKDGSDLDSAIEQEINEEQDNIPLDELQKPLKEEQKWINLIIENPKNITAYKFLGLFYWKQYNYNDAKKSLEMAVKLGSKDKKVNDVLKKIKKMGVR